MPAYPYGSSQTLKRTSCELQLQNLLELLEAIVYRGPSSEKHFLLQQLFSFDSEKIYKSVLAYNHSKLKAEQKEVRNMVRMRCNTLSCARSVLFRL